MKKICLLFLGLALSLAAQTENPAGTVPAATEEKMSGSLVAGATTINGENYQQIGFRADIPVGKFGFGLDIQLLLDNDGNIRKADWDEAKDYLDKIYYIRYAKKGDPFYARVGGLDNSTLGYGIAMCGYSNMLEYPSVKKIGLETAFETETFGGEMIFNNFKELLNDKPGMLIGARGYYKVWGDLRVGAGFAADLNEYNGLTDTDGDGYADRLDQFPDDEDLVTKREQIVAKLKAKNTYTDAQIQAIVDGMIDIGELDKALKEDQTKHGDLTSKSAIMAFDIGYPLVKSEFFSLDVYGQAAQIIDYGFGFAAPAAIAKMGPLTLKAEYRHSGKEFMFGYYDQTYELERATFIDVDPREDHDSLVAFTKKESLKLIKDPMNGFFAGAAMDFFGFVNFGINYQQMSSDSLDIKSLQGELALNAEKIPKLSKAKAYYIQNNVEDFKHWKTPSTILGYVIGYKISEGVSLDFNYRYNFVDKNGNREIEGDEETVKTIGISTTMIF